MKDAVKFDVIYADPPWQYRFQIKNGLAKDHYETMPTEEICSFHVPSAEDSILFLWSTNPLLPDGLLVMQSWGFQYKTNLVWVKDKIGVGHYLRGRHELLLLGIKGKIGTPNPSDVPDSVIDSRRMRHSHKPQKVYDIIETMYPGKKYLELFASTVAFNWITQ